MLCVCQCTSRCTRNSLHVHLCKLHDVNCIHACCSPAPLQLYVDKVRLDETQPAGFDLVKSLVDVGDVVGVSGAGLKRTDKGELSVIAGERREQGHMYDMHNVHMMGAFACSSQGAIGERAFYRLSMIPASWFSWVDAHTAVDVDDASGPPSW